MSLPEKKQHPQSSPVARTSGQRLARRNGIVALAAVGLVVSMIGLSFAAVPLYRIFCQVTGFAGTTQQVEAAPEKIGTRKITVRFDANVAGGLNWKFKPVQRQVTLRVGEAGLAYYTATNTSDERVTGTATYNVTPLKAGAYFSKVACFCFTEQTLAAGQKVDMPVSFFVDPEIVNDRNLDDVHTITLSYTFFRAKGARPTDRTAKLDVAEEPRITAGVAIARTVN